MLRSEAREDFYLKSQLCFSNSPEALKPSEEMGVAPLGGLPSQRGELASRVHVTVLGPVEPPLHRVKNDHNIPAID